ncbi:MAG: hypothetical protein IBX55_08800 [Methyloprofundus sp.]|nr:hypothetical protein [Methyloprofundus sp.]
MSFENTVLNDNLDLGAGEVIASSPYNVSSFETFEAGLVAGRFVKYDAGSIDNLDASASPLIAGIAKRNITESLDDDSNTQVAQVINFGFATVEVTAAATPVKYESVQVVNDATADAGKATNAAGVGIVPAGDVVFWEQKAADVWLVRINKFI